MRTVFIKRRLFSEDPKKRFGRVFHCHPNIWADVWKRYKILDYSEDEAREYLIFVLRQGVTRRRFRRWIERTESFNRAQIALKKGANEVTSDYFGNLKGFVEREITKNN